jgi:TadE-like protein
MRRKTGSRNGAAVVEFVVAGPVLLLVILSAIQISLLLAGQGSVDTAAHFAAREFAQSGRSDAGNAKRTALAQAISMCRMRPGGGFAKAAMTSLDFSREGAGRGSGMPAAGEAYRVTLKHWVELAVPMANRILFALAPIEKVRLGKRYYLVLHATRFVTVE